MENLFQKLKTAKEEEAQEILRRLRGSDDPDSILGRSVGPPCGKYVDESQKDGPDDVDSISLSESTKLDTSAVCADEDGCKPTKPDVGSQPGLQATLIDKLSQVMSQLNIDNGGEVRYFGPSSNLNLVPDVPLVPVPARSSDSSEGDSASPNHLSDVYDVDPNFAVGTLDSSAARTRFDCDSYFNIRNAPTFKDNRTGLGFSHTHSEDQALEEHLLSLYWTWQHPFFRLFSKRLFLRDMELARSANAVTAVRKLHFTPLLLNAILAHASHLSNRPGVRSNPDDPTTAGDGFFAKARRLLEDECESPSITTVQALALMGSREAGCGRDTGLGWLYSGMLACDYPSMDGN